MQFSPPPLFSLSPPPGPHSPYPGISQIRVNDLFYVQCHTRFGKLEKIGNSLLNGHRASKGNEYWRLYMNDFFREGRWTTPPPPFPITTTTTTITTTYDKLTSVISCIYLSITTRHSSNGVWHGKDSCSIIIISGSSIFEISYRARHSPSHVNNKILELLPLPYHTSYLFISADITKWRPMCGLSDPLPRYQSQVSFGSDISLRIW